MKRFVILCLLSAFAVICMAQSSEKARPRTADDVLKAYAQRVHAELLPRVNDITTEEIQHVASEIASQVLIPNKELLVAKAKSNLAALPKSELDLASGWETILDAGGGMLAKQMAKFPRATSQPATRPVDMDALCLMALWNPQGAAGMVRGPVMMEHLGTNGYFKRTMIEYFARPIVSAISSDPQHPVIAFETGPELFVVSLKLTDAGYYLDENVKWLKRKDAASQPSSAGGKD